jgi:hypothetical protein
MSTRCQVLVEGSNAIVYRHSDGSPEAVLPDLLPLVADFMKSRGNDPEYMTAHIVARFIALHNTWLDSRLAQYDGDTSSTAEVSRRSYNQYRYLGYGVEGFQAGDYLHGDTEFLYVIKADHVEVRVPTKAFNAEPTLANTKVQSKFRFDGTKVKRAAKMVL